METNNGALFFKAGIDWSIWDNDMGKLVKDAKENAKKIHEQSGLIDKAFANTGKELGEIFNKNIIENLKKMGVQSSLTSREMKDAIQDVTEYVDGLNASLQNMIKQEDEMFWKITKAKQLFAKENPNADPSENQEIKKMVTEHEQLKVAISETQTVITGANALIEEYSKSQATLTQKLSETKKEMQELKLAGRENSDTYIQLSEDAAKYDKAIKDVNKEVAGLSGGLFPSFIASLNGVSSTVVAGVGVLGLFNQQNEKFRAVTEKVSEITAIAVGIQGLYTTSLTAGTSVTNFMTAATSRLSTALGISTVAARTMLITITGGLILAVPVLIAMYDRLVKKSEELSRVKKDIAAAHVEGAQNAAQENGQLQILYRTATNTTLSMQQRLQAVKALQKEYPSYFGNLNQEAILAGNAVNQYRALSKAIIAASQARAIQAKMDAENEKFYAKEQELIQRLADLKIKYANAKGGSRYEVDPNDPKGRVLVQYSADEEKAKLKAEQKWVIDNMVSFYKTRKAVNDKFVDEITKKTKQSFQLESEDPKAPDSISERLSKIKSRMQELAADGKTGSAEFKSLSKEALKLQAAMDSVNGVFSKSKTADADSISERLSKIKEKMQFLALAGKETSKEYKNLEAEGLRLAKALETVNKSFGNDNSENFAINSVAEIRKRLSAIDEALEKANDSDLIEGLKKTRIETAKELAEAQKRISTEAIEAEKSDARKKLEALLELQRNFEEKKNAIIEDHSKMRAAALTDDERQKVDKSQQEALAKLMSDEVKNSKAWIDAFGEIEKYSIEKLQEVRDSLQEKMQSMVADGTATPEAIKAMQDQIQKLNDAINNQNFLPNFTKLIKSVGDESLSTAEKISVAQEEIAKIQQQLKYAGEIASGVEDTFKSLGGNMDSTFGDILGSVQQTIQGLQQFSEGAAQAITGFASGNILQGIAGGIKAIGGLVKSISSWFNGDKKKERNIKAWADEVENLKNKYDQLSRAVEKMYGDAKYSAQKQQVESLKQQQAAIQKMMTSEMSKKKADQSKINDYKNQIQSITNQIEDLTESIVDSITQIDVRSLADDLGSALLEAWQKGADGANIYADTAKKAIQNAVFEALKQEILAPQMEIFKKSLFKAMGYQIGSDGKITGSFDGITDGEMSSLQEQLKFVSQSFQEKLNGLNGLFDITGANPQGLKGDIKGVTEKTAGALEAQINAMRIYQVEGLNIHKENQTIFADSLRNLTLIEQNTRPLHEINLNIRSIKNKVEDQNLGLRASGLIN